MNTRDFIRERKEQNTFTKEKLLSEDRIEVSYNDGDFEFCIKNTLSNIAQFIMFTAVYAAANNDSDYSVAFYIEYESFMNTMGYFIDLCANTEYLEALKKELIPLQLEYEECVFNNKDIPEYTFVMFEGDRKERIVSSKKDINN